MSKVVLLSCSCLLLLAVFVPSISLADPSSHPWSPNQDDSSHELPFWVICTNRGCDASAPGRNSFTPLEFVAAAPIYGDSAAVLTREISIEIDTDCPEEFSRGLTEAAGLPMSFELRSIESSIRIDIKRISVSRVLELLGSYGGCAIRDGERISVEMRALDSAEISKLLTRVVDGSVTFSAYKEGEIFSIQVRLVSVTLLLELLQEYGTIVVAEAV